VLEAANGREALDISGAFEGTVHLVVTDVVMPEMSGRALVAQIEADRPGTRVIFVSGYPDNALFHDGKLTPEVAFLQKPFTADMLKMKVREVLDLP
jgi:YesN/AraC family two-component response regulator